MKKQLLLLISIFVLLTNTIQGISPKKLRQMKQQKLEEIKKQQTKIETDFLDEKESEEWKTKTESYIKDIKITDPKLAEKLSEEMIQSYEKEKQQIGDNKNKIEISIGDSLILVSGEIENTILNINNIDPLNYEYNVASFLSNQYVVIDNWKDEQIDILTDTLALQDQTKKITQQSYNELALFVHDNVANLAKLLLKKYNKLISDSMYVIINSIEDLVITDDTFPDVVTNYLAPIMQDLSKINEDSYDLKPDKYEEVATNLLITQMKGIFSIIYSELESEINFSNKTNAEKYLTAMTELNVEYQKIKLKNIYDKKVADSVLSAKKLFNEMFNDAERDYKLLKLSIKTAKTEVISSIGSIILALNDDKARVEAVITAETTTIGDGITGYFDGGIMFLDPDFKTSYIDVLAYDVYNVIDVTFPQFKVDNNIEDKVKDLVTVLKESLDEHTKILALFADSSRIDATTKVSITKEAKTFIININEIALNIENIFNITEKITTIYNIDMSSTKTSYDTIVNKIDIIETYTP